MFNIFLYWVGSLLIGELLRPKPKFNTPQPSALGEIQMPTAQLGRPLPVVYGTNKLKGPNVTWFGDLKTVAIKEKVKTSMFSSKKVTKGYKYYLGAQLVFCHGFSPSELERGSGLVELHIDDKRPTALGKDEWTEGVDMVAKTVSARGASYTKQYINKTDYNTRRLRITIDDPQLFGGEDKEGGFSGPIDFFYGQAEQERSDYLQAQFGTSDIPAYRGMCYAVMRQCYVGTTNYAKPVAAIVQRFPWFNASVNGYNINGDANPCAIIIDLLVNKSYGLGLPLAKVDADGTLYEAAKVLWQEGLGLSFVYDTQQPARELIDDVLRHIDGVLYTDPSDGMIKIKLARADYEMHELPVLDTSNVAALQLTRSTWEDTKNVVKVKYTNRARNYETDVVEHQNYGAIAARGGLRDEETYNFLGVSNAELANRIAARVLRTVSTPLARVTLTVNREAFELHPGAVFKLNWAPLGVSEMACRVTRISYGTLSDPEIEIEAVQDIFGLTATAITAPSSTSDWLDPLDEAPVPHTADALVEAPYHFIGGEERHVLTLAARASGLTHGYKVFYRQNGEMIESQDVSEHTPSGVLLHDYAANTDAIDYAGIEVAIGIDGELLQSITEAQQLAGINLLQIGEGAGAELCTWRDVEYVGDGVYAIKTLYRGVLDTPPRTHLAGTRVWFISDGVGQVRDEPFEEDQQVVASLRPYNSYEVAGSAANKTITTTSRAYKPYPAGRLRVNNIRNARSVIGTAVCEWSHRNRRAMLAERRVLSQDMYPYNSTEGGTYTIRVKVGGSVRKTLTGQTTDSASYTPAERAALLDGSLPVTFEITTVENGYSSTPHETAPFLMTGLGMCLGLALGGEQA